MAPDPTGRRLAAVDRRPNGSADALHLFDLATGAEEQKWPLPPGTTAEAPAWNDDGTLLAAGVGRTVHVWALGEGPPRPLVVLERHQNNAVLCRFVPGTGLLLSSSCDMLTRLWDPVGGRQLLTLPGHVAAIAADGRVAVADAVGGYAVCRLDPAAECRLLHHGLMAEEQVAAAHVHFSAALALLPDRPAIRQARLTTAVRLGRWPEALADADALMGHWPDEESVQFGRGAALHGLGRDPEAADAFGRMIQLTPDEPMPYIFRAECFDALNRPTDAAADRDKAEALAANNSLALNNLAWPYANGPVKSRQPKRAVALARRAVRIRPDAPLYLNTLGVALYRDGQYAEAVTVLEKSLAASHGASDGWDLFVLAMCRHRLGQPEHARSDLTRAVAWVEKQTGVPDRERSELAAFRTEAEELLRGKN